MGGGGGGGGGGASRVGGKPYRLMSGKPYWFMSSLPGRMAGLGNILLSVKQGCRVKPLV